MLEQNVASLPQTKTTAGSKVEAVGAWALAAMFAFVVFLLWGTGLSTDDYVHLLDGFEWRFVEHWWPKEYLSLPLLHYTHGLAFFFIGDRPWAYDLLKAVYAGAGVYFASCFFAIFCPPRRALLLAFVFLFLPLLDGAIYSLTELYLVVSFTCYLYAYALGANGRLRLSVLFALLGSFSSYGSPPIAIGLSFLAFLQGNRKLSGTLLIPNLIYVAYYLTTSLVLKLGTPRLIGEFGIVALTKQMLLQVVTFFDATVGPSAWLKIFYSIASLNVLSCLVAVAAASASIYYLAAEPRSTADRSLIAAAAVIVVGSFGMFSLTGLYPQIAFGLGDRIMIYGSFFLICIFATLRLPRIVESAAIVLVFLSIGGIANHWKQWGREVDRVAANIRLNQEFRKLPAGALLYVSHHQYSRLGPYAHIEFFTATYVVRAFFRLQLGAAPAFELASFNRRLDFKDGVIRDRKFGDSMPVSGAIWLYNSERDVIERVPAADITARIDALPDENRHWTQQLPDGWIKQHLLQLVPRLRYAY